jgi:hypothetical protein
MTAEERYFLKGMILTFLLGMCLVADFLLGFAFSDKILGAWNDFTYNLSEGLAWIDEDLKQLEKGFGL